MKRILRQSAAGFFTLVLALSLGVILSQASEGRREKGQPANKGMSEQDAKAREVETLIRTGRMIEEEGRRTNDKTMIKNGQMMIKEGQMIKEGKWPQ